MKILPVRHIISFLCNVCTRVYHTTLPSPSSACNRVGRSWNFHFCSCAACVRHECADDKRSGIAKTSSIPRFLFSGLLCDKSCQYCLLWHCSVESGTSCRGRSTPGSKYPSRNANTSVSSITRLTLQGTRRREAVCTTTETGAVSRGRLWSLICCLNSSKFQIWFRWRENLHQPKKYQLIFKTDCGRFISSNTYMLLEESYGH